MSIATGVPGLGTKLLALPIFMAVVALTRVCVHPLRLHGYDAARLIMALELVLLLAFVAGGLGYLVAGFYGGLVPAAVLLMLIIVREKSG